ncbi:Uncharacterised protein [uncultured Flavonifractor sp.]|nr:Uncharacterised protein [uncultured Flavonifractor sp.]
MSILNQNLLTLDFWQDKVTYGKQTVPIGTIGCAALNITDEQIAKLTTLCQPLTEIILMLGTGNVDVSVFPVAEKALLKIIRFLQKTEPFSFLDLATDETEIHRLFDEAHIENIITYIKAAQEIGAVAAFDEKYSRGVGVLKLIQVIAQLGGTLQIYKQSMTAFAHALHDSQRTPDGYAAAFAEHFPKDETLSPDNSTWMQLTNTTMQYVSAVMPEKGIPQLVKRMHYVSFVGMFRSDLFEGLCVGHAPRLCPICGKWFLTTDARQTKYCGGLAPGDKLGRTCRQIGNLKGREQRELADDHPVKAIYTRRMNTITQYLHRGTLDEQTAAVMKQLAKDKLELAIENVSYAKGDYEKEMEQTALLNEARKRL